MDTGNRTALRLMVKRVAGLLRHYPERGLLRSIHQAGK
jgi:hypothetical protein